MLFIIIALVAFMILTSLFIAAAAMAASSADNRREELLRQHEFEASGGVESRHASQHRDGTGCWNPAQGNLVREQRKAERLETLIAPTQAGVAPGPLASSNFDRCTMVIIEAEHRLLAR
jgi:hypothetical protein